MSKILITGTSSGFGRMAVETFAKKGHQVIATMRGVKGKNAEAAAALSAIDGVQVEELDVTNQATIDAVAAKVGGVDVLINNAGLGQMGLTETFTAEDAHRVFDVNYYGVIRMTNAFLPAMRAKGEGLIINISSTLGQITMPFVAHYCPSKHALESYTESLKMDLAYTGVELAMIQPGGFGTNFFGNLLPASKPEVAEAYGEMAEAPAKMGASLGEAFGGPDAPSPMLVVDAMVALVEAPKGKRPFKTPVDPMGQSFIEAINEMHDSKQHEMLVMYGMAPTEA